MKKSITLSLLLLAILICSSFKTKHARMEEYKNSGTLQAIVDGKIFEPREANMYTAVLKSKSTDNMAYYHNPGAKLTRVANTISFYGADFKDADGNTFNESLGFEYTFNEGALGEGANERITLNYRNEKYYNVEGETKLKITKIQWSPDRRSFVMSADFECIMRRWGIPAKTEPTLKLKGKMDNINVTVPSWIVIKNPRQVAEN